MDLPFAERKPKTFSHGFKVHYSEKFHAVRADRILVLDDVDMSKRKCFEQRVDEIEMSDGFVGVSRLRWKNLCEFPTSQ
jgi:hypothetical protein